MKIWMEKERLGDGEKGRMIRKDGVSFGEKKKKEERRGLLSTRAVELAIVTIPDLEMKLFIRSI